LLAVDNRFLFAFTDPGEIKLLGRFVYPFCIKYRVRLLAINSPLVNTHRDIEPLDLVLAVQICSERRFGDLGWLDHWYLAKLNRDKNFFAETVFRFTAYAYQSVIPKFWEKSGKTEGSNTSGLDWTLMVVANLIANGISEERAWNMPECQAIWLSTAFIKIKGGEVNVLTTEEEEFMEEQRKAKEESDKGVAEKS
jgi:hypothetical protein